MTALQSLQGLPQASAGDSTVTVLVAAEPEENTVIQRSNLRGDLSAEFLSAAKESVPPANQEVRPRAYEAGYNYGLHLTLVVAHTGESFHSVFTAGGIKLIARSESAVMVRLGLTPRLAATTEPSQMYIFL
jgi:hypothetical protein